MNAPSALTQSVHRRLAQVLASGDDQALARALRILAQWRSQLLENTQRARVGDVVAAGPFAGMLANQRSAEGAGLPRLLGCYEPALIPAIEAMIARSPALVVDIGSAEGYYAVGLARRLPKARVMARDTNPAAQKACAALAVANDVADRVTVGGLMDHAGLAVCADQPSAVICDIEGDEEVLLDPVAAPGLVNADILVECHDCFRPGIADRLAARFAATHEVSRLERRIMPDALPEWSDNISELDQLLMLWEWRAGPTPWLWMQARQRA